VHHDIGLTHWWGWSLSSSLILGLALLVASTVVLMRALESHGIPDSGSGGIVVGWLIVEDLFTVLILALLPAVAPVLVGPQISSEIASHDPGNGPLLFTFGIALGKFVGEFSFALASHLSALSPLPQSFPPLRSV
jgi:monovalent cation:H+ antiporter-2, CPA2 family